MKKVRIIREVGRLLLLLGGVLSFVVGLRCLIQPNRLLSGGVTGASLLLHGLMHLPVGLVIAILNIPIFVLGTRFVGRRFALYSGLGVVASWLLLDYAPFRPLTNDPMLAGVFGGVLFGLGTALALKAGGSLGGFDILGVVVNRRFGLGVGEVLLVLNGALVLAAGIMGSPELAMYTLLAIFVTGKTIDTLTAPRRRKAFLIMTRHPQSIREQVLRTMGRGMTVFKAEGGYTGSDIEALLCVVQRPELRELNDIIRREDPEAFVVVLDPSEVSGSFRSLSAASYWRRLQDPSS